MERNEKRELADATELPLIALLRRSDITPRDARPTRAHLIQFYTQYLENSEREWSIFFPINGLRSTMVKSLLLFIAMNKQGGAFYPSNFYYLRKLAKFFLFLG